MKVFVPLLIFIYMNNSCGQKNVSPQTDTVINSIEYKASSRGFLYRIVINEDTLRIQKGFDSEVRSYSCLEEDWKQLVETVNLLDLETFEHLQSPTESRFTDAGHAAEVALTVNDKTYTTKSFDHGNPPKAIENLVNTILTLAERIEKQ